jgi:hypothetical protein
LFKFGSILIKEPKNSTSISMPVRSKIPIEHESILKRLKAFIIESFRLTNSLEVYINLNNFYDISTEISNGVLLNCSIFSLIIR